MSSRRTRQSAGLPPYTKIAAIFCWATAVFNKRPRRDCLICCASRAWRRTDWRFHEAMKVFRQRNGTVSFALKELVVIIAVIGVLIGVIAPWLAKSRRQSSGMYCANILKAIGSSFRVFADDNEDKFSWHISTNNGGSREYLEVPNSAFRHFQVMSNELSTPKILVCPEDRKRVWSTNWVTGFDNQNVSYFVGLNSS